VYYDTTWYLEYNDATMRTEYHYSTSHSVLKTKVRSKYKPTTVQYYIVLQTTEDRFIRSTTTPRLPDRKYVVVTLSHRLRSHYDHLMEDSDHHVTSELQFKIYWR